MSLYQNILVAVDLTDESPMVLNKALDLAKQYDAKISMVHVIEPIAIGYAVEVSSIDIEGLHEEASRQAKQSLEELGEDVGIPSERLYNLLGNPGREIRELAKKIEADLVVLGGHARHGWEVLFGSTSTEVSHGIQCDMLVVRIPEKKRQK